ncbi:MAG: hypothetical protein ACRC78_11605 [Planktothrix sp.]
MKSLTGLLSDVCEVRSPTLFQSTANLWPEPTPSGFKPYTRNALTRKEVSTD